ncbi:SusC/RagA family TonB-linked outer membrane protein [Pedobacter sp. CG_S7]|uniref:SusC/RagA family TonB-linked outer membrane protein n=1 Tax=Pedobacter sp. CG_S7 TaxID=3143930 RepID=UPI003396942A
MNEGNLTHERVNSSLNNSGLNIQAQEIVITGHVYDDTGLTIPGTLITEKGTTNKTSANGDGYFSIRVKIASSVLVINSLGFVAKEVVIGTQRSIKVTLETSTNNLEDVVVIGYGTQKRIDLTGAVVSADLKQFSESPNTNILQSLQGSLPGITIGQTSSTGQDPKVQIRGVNTLSGNTGVLIVLDGAVYRGSLNDINPNDIASIDVLKDPSSKAIYGAQAANGVILVTSKKGKTSQKTEVNFSTYYAFQDPIKDRRTLNRAEFIESSRDANYKIGFLAPDYTTPNPTYDYLANSGGSFPAIVVNGIAAGTDFDWYKAGTNSNIYTANYQLNIRGGSENTTYFLSGGYTDQAGWIINDNYARKSARINIDSKITDWLSIGTNTFGAFSDRSGNSPSLINLALMSPLITHMDDTGNYILNPSGTSLINPFLQSQQDDLNKQNNISSIVYASINVPGIKGLNYRINYSNDYRWNLFGTSSIYNGGNASKINNSTYDTSLDNILTYDRRFGKEEQHGLKATLVAGFNTIRYEGTTASATQFSNLALSYNSLEQGLKPFVSSDAWQERYISQTARFNYDYNGKYLFNASIRRDGFSGFSENNKFGLFPSVGLGWVISREPYLENFDKINLLKLRGSYGLNGNTTGRYSSLAMFQSDVSQFPGSSSQYIFGDAATTVNGIYPSTLSNRNLRWELTKGVNMGLDFALYENKISGSVDYYNSKTKDLLWFQSLSQVTGFPGIQTNIGGIHNKGIDLYLNFKAIQSKSFTWDLGFNFTKNTNKITSLFGKDLNEDGNEDDLIANSLFIGKSIGSIYTYVEDGIYQLGDDVPTGFSVGGYKLKDLNGDGSISEADRTIIGKAEPDYQFGITNSLKYKNFSLKFFINSVQGGLGRNDPWLVPDNLRSYSTTSTVVVHNRFNDIDYWSPRNPNAEYAMPATLTGNVQYSPYKDKSFVRLQDISLAYNLSEKLLSKTGFSNLKIYVSGKNLYTLTKWNGWDPETGDGLGITSSGLPVLKSISFGLDLTF